MLSVFLAKQRKKEINEIKLIVDSEYTDYFEVLISLYNTKTQYNAVIHTIKRLAFMLFIG